MINEYFFGETIPRAKGKQHISFRFSFFFLITQGTACSAKNVSSIDEKVNEKAVNSEEQVSKR